MINGKSQSSGESFTVENFDFTDAAKTARFSIEIVNAYPKEAQVYSWVLCYTMNRGKNFIISDKFQLSGLGEIPTGSYMTTHCKISGLKPGLLKFEADGFILDLRNNPKIVDPGIEYSEVKDNSLKSNWAKEV